MTGKRRQSRPSKYFKPREWQRALKEARRLSAGRDEKELPICVWKYVGGYVGSGYFVGTGLPTRITSSKAVVTLYAVNGRTSVRGG